MKYQISDMEPNEIRIEMLRRGVTQSGLARDIGVTVQSVHRIIENKNVSHKIRMAVAKAIGKDLKEIWPSTYLYGGGPRKRGRPVCHGKKNRAA
jgi:lambda repressor-like predicted transcriptional regulator